MALDGNTQKNVESMDLEAVRRNWVKDWNHDDRTHWEDCWKIHHECCTERLCREIEALRGES